MDLSDLSASLPPSNFGTCHGTREPSRVFDSRDFPAPPHHHFAFGGVDPRAAADAINRAFASQQNGGLAPELSQASSVASACSGMAAALPPAGPTAPPTTTIISTVQGEEAAIAMRGPGKRWCASHIKGLPKRNCNESDILPQVSQAS